MTDSFEQANRAFWQWLEDNGTELSKSIAIEDYRNEEAGRGVVATSDIKEGEVLFSLPRNILLTPLHSSLRSLQGMDVILDSLKGWSVLILCLMYESQKKDSFWKPYFDVLSTSFSTPMFWSEEELKMLQGTAIVDKIGKQDAEAMFESDILPIIKGHPDIFDESIHTVDLFHTCGSLVMAYSFTDELGMNPTKKENEDKEDEDKEDEDEDEEDEEDENTMIAMVPLADTLNHKTGFNNARLFHESDCLKMKAIKDIAVGEQIFNTYGELCNADLLRKYGFVDSVNEFDLVELNGAFVTDILFNPQDDEDLRDRKLQFLMEEGVLDDFFILDNSLEMPEELIITACVLQSLPHEFEKMETKQKLPKPKQTPEMTRLFIVLLKKRLELYPSIELAVSMNLNQRNALAVQKGECKILKEIIAMLKNTKRPADTTSINKAKRQK
ncbi:hypothetical protein BDF14DRAFT_1753557 [Spinellus fusiger]|nr:hypothetical protein BDF14DRAFT_1753557 [Spinellus fusiger]